MKDHPTDFDGKQFGGSPVFFEDTKLPLVGIQRELPGEKRPTASICHQTQLGRNFLTDLGPRDGRSLALLNFRGTPPDFRAPGWVEVGDFRAE